MRVVHDDGRVDQLAVKPSSLEVPPTAVVSVETPGAGGYGPPEKRPREALVADYEDGKFSADYLKRHYGFEPEAAG